MPIFDQMMLGLGAIIATMTALWLISLWLRDASIVDIFWGSGFVLLAWVYRLLDMTFVARDGLLLLLVTVWGLRLTLYLLLRNWGQGEDFRYRQWRKEHGNRWWWRSYFQVFLLQGIIMWFVALPLLGAQSLSVSPGLVWLDYLAILIWLIGFAFEAGGDWQLMRFKSNPANTGEILDSGFWRYTRHPNYFGDAAQWWAFYLLALAAGAWWTILSPILMTFLLLRVSGVAMLEKSLKKRKPEYQAYIERTSAFLPMPPKKRQLSENGD